MQKNNVIKKIKDQFDILPEFPWEKDPDISVYRHKDNRKWFAIIMPVSKNRLGLQGEDKIDLINIKLSPTEVTLLKNQDGFLPAYHMNKQHWITIKLDKTLKTDFILELIEQSYNITKTRITRKNNSF